MPMPAAEEQPAEEPSEIPVAAAAETDEERNDAPAA
jgi:hypothetical protein